MSALLAMEEVTDALSSFPNGISLDKLSWTNKTIGTASTASHETKTK